MIRIHSIALKCWVYLLIFSTVKLNEFVVKLMELLIISWLIHDLIWRKNWIGWNELLWLNNSSFLVKCYFNKIWLFFSIWTFRNYFPWTTFLLSDLLSLFTILHAKRINLTLNFMNFYFRSFFAFIVLITVIEILSVAFV
jgi:hypothetical protein